MVGSKHQHGQNFRKYTQLHIIHYVIHRSCTPIFYILVCIVIVYAISCMTANAFRFRRTAKKLYTTTYRTFRYCVVSARYVLLDPSSFVHVMNSKNADVTYKVILLYTVICFCLMQR